MTDKFEGVALGATGTYSSPDNLGVCGQGNLVTGQVPTVSGLSEHVIKTPSLPSGADMQPAGNDVMDSTLPTIPPTK